MIELAALNRRHLLRGAGSLMNLIPSQTYQQRLREIRPYRTDAEALASDGQQVSRDLRRAFDQAISDRRAND